MPQKPPRISESEWIVANVLWDHPGLTATEVLDRLPPGPSWKQKTVNTFLTRLVEKGVLATERAGKANTYHPLLAREACVQSASLLQRILGPKPAPMLAHFCETTPLTDEEIEQLKSILEQRQAKSKGTDK
jgi:BlaI family penicillinase repressor